MPALKKYDRDTLQREHDRRRGLGEKQEDIAKDIVPGGMPLGTLRNILSEMRRKSAQPSTPPKGPMPEDVVEVLPGQMTIDADTVPGGDEAPVSATTDIVPVIGEIVEHLSPAEVQTLARYEHVIAQGIKTFVDVGHALLTIRDQHLYRGSYTTFEDYCRQRWDLSRPRAYQLIDAAQVIDTVSTIVDIVPVNEAQARALTTLPTEQQREVWREAVETAPASGITAKHVQQTVKRVKAQRKSSAHDLTPEDEEYLKNLKFPKAAEEGEWLRRFDARCVRIHEFLGELTRAGGVEVFVRGWEPRNQAEFIKRAQHWETYLSNFRRHLENVLSRGESDISHTTEVHHSPEDLR
jgi:hypothetical protein